MNQPWARQLVKEIIHQGVRSFCIAPGSRSTPLALALAEHPLAKTLLHFDERGLAFHALGIAKSGNAPVAIVVTSGTAVGNLLPAIMEAYHSHVPLLILTADRPPELRDVGANQTGDQVKLFGDYVRGFYDLPCPDPALPKNYLGSLIAHAMRQVMSGPVHLNCMFRDPLIGKQSGPTGSRHAHTQSIQSRARFEQKDLEHLADSLGEVEKGLILVGNIGNPHSLDPLILLARRLQWPILPDILSSPRWNALSDFTLPFYENLTLNCDAVIHLGDRMTSKKFLSLSPSLYVHVTPYKERIDPAHLVTHRCQGDPMDFCMKMGSILSGRRPSPHLQNLLGSGHAVEKKLPFLKDNFSEPSLFPLLANTLSTDTALFIGNSMPIRDADSFFFPKKPTGPIFANRGLSGIDGNIATAKGIAQGHNSPVVAIMGDLTFLHDLNSLAIPSKHPILFIVINNHGGGIFQTLPIAQKKSALEYFVTPHTYSFKHIAAQFGLAYSKAKSLSSIRTPKEDTLIELTTSAETATLLRKEWLQTVP